MFVSDSLFLNEILWNFCCETRHKITFLWNTLCRYYLFCNTSEKTRLVYRLGPDYTTVLW